MVQLRQSILAGFRLRKVEQGIPILDRVQETYAELQRLSGEMDDSDLKVAEDQWDVLLLLAEALEHYVAQSSHQAAAVRTLAQDYETILQPLIEWHSAVETALQSLQPPRNASTSMLKTNIAHIVELHHECEQRCSVLADLIELDYTLRENRGRPNRDSLTVKQVITMLADINSRCEATLLAHFEAMEHGVHIDDLSDAYRLRSGHFIQWCAGQRVAADIHTETLSSVANAELVISKYEREKPQQQQRLSELESVWLELEASHADLRGITPASELASTLRELGWLIAQRSSRVDALVDQQQYQQSLISQWLEFGKQVFPWLGSSILSLALFKFGRSLEDSQACQKELEEFREQQTSAASTISYLQSLQSNLAENAPQDAAAAQIVALLTQTLTVSWDELQSTMNARSEAIQHALSKHQQLLAARNTFIDEAHILHPLLQNVLGTAQRLAAHDFMQPSDEEKAELTRLFDIYESHSHNMHSLLASSDILTLFGTVAISTGFLSIEVCHSKYIMSSLFTCISGDPSALATIRRIACTSTRKTIGCSHTSSSAR